MKQKLAAPYNSDHACLLNAVTGYTDASNQGAFCDQWHLNQATMRQIRDQQNRLYTECQENKTDSFANRNRGNFQLLVAVLCAGIFPNIARRRGSSDFYEAQGGKVEARPHGSSAYIPKQPDEWVFFQELSQMESTYKLKSVSPIEPLPMMLLGGEGPLTIDAGKAGKGGKGGFTTVSLLDGWCKFRTDLQTAEQMQKLRGALQAAFQSFCAKPDDIPDPDTMALLDQAAAMISSSNGDAGGVKRPAAWPADGDAARGGPMSRASPKSFGGGFKGGGKGGGCKGGGKMGGGKGWKGGKGW